ncbi:hypothetical protein PVAP13_3KG151900 [Panicum virgatum]|uniref:SIAH-type domain-containing protein n=1 Tax=Panicum virgatum TaxID=38727 RepID=A0A8T0UPW0_PANVG|nr:hypothetical protein PVAP13_3KG151900 [Panicum virgatum]
MEVERVSSYHGRRRRRSPVVFDAGDASSFSFRRKRSRMDYGGGDAVAEDQSRRGGGRAGEDLLPRPRAEEEEEEEDSDDERPIRFVRRRGSTAGPPSQAPATVATAPEPSPSSSCSNNSSSVIWDATVEDHSALDCSIFYLPLKPPIFQCHVGHVVCCRCNDKLRPATQCHKCRAPTPGGYRRSYDMETLLGAIRVPCPNAARGCAHRPAYHDRDAHALACPHAAPCRCPGEACGFAGPAAALADHVAAEHGWPCTAVDADGPGTSLILRDGFNFLTVTASRAAAAATSPSHGAATSKFLFLLNVVPARLFGRVITVFCIHPDRTATATASPPPPPPPPKLQLSRTLASSSLSLSVSPSLISLSPLSAAAAPRQRGVQVAKLPPRPPAPSPQAATARRTQACSRRLAAQEQCSPPLILPIPPFTNPKFPNPPSPHAKCQSLTPAAPDRVQQRPRGSKPEAGGAPSRVQYRRHSVDLPRRRPQRLLREF